VGRRLGLWRRVAVVVVKPTMTVLSKRDWRGMEHIPPTGGVIVVANHMSHFDPMALAHYVYDAGRWPAFLAKASVFKVPVIGKMIGWAGQIPVSRGTVDAVRALDAAVNALRSGECVVVYPEGTTTKEPDLWPMRGKTGAARLWLETGVPVVPVAMWGPQRLFDPRTKKMRLRPNTPVTVVAGPPIDLSKWRGAPPTNATLHEITEHIMLTLRAMVAEIRGEEPPDLWAPTNGKRSGSTEKETPAGGDEGDH
jgi:1-acyl-sn-glycerol-3-phosphate acyltransferase